MADKFDPYREALVMETTTIWPAEFDDLEAQRKERISAELHANPEHAGSLQYVRTHTGFCRQITVTPQDIERVAP